VLKLKNKLAIHGFVSEPGAAVRFACGLLSLVFLFALVGGANSGANVHGSAVAPPQLSQPFAIADFDGDHVPDIATVETGQSDSFRSDYWIQLRLTTAGRQSIRLVAPAGGLLIEARDVNGDHAIDIVLSTAWLRQPVAILLNDGHGGFSRVGPEVFPGAFAQSTNDSVSALDQEQDAASVLPQPRGTVCPEAASAVCLLANADAVPPARAKLLSNAFLSSHSGRAPPLLGPHI